MSSLFYFLKAKEKKRNKKENLPFQPIKEINKEK